MKTPMSNWKIQEAIEKIIVRNCEEIPYEGTEVNSQGLLKEIYELILKVRKETEDILKKEIEGLHEDNAGADL